MLPNSTSRLPSGHPPDRVPDTLPEGSSRGVPAPFPTGCQPGSGVCTQHTLSAPQPAHPVHPRHTLQHHTPTTRITSHTNTTHHTHAHTPHTTRTHHTHEVQPHPYHMMMIMMLLLRWRWGPRAEGPSPQGPRSRARRWMDAHQAVSNTDAYTRTQA